LPARNHDEEGGRVAPGLALATLGRVTVLVALGERRSSSSRLQKAGRAPFGMTRPSSASSSSALVGGAAEMASAFSGGGRTGWISASASRWAARRRSSCSSRGCWCC